MKKIIILGAGIAGISCGYHLQKNGINSTLYEKKDYWGGLCSSFSLNGFRFDRFAHFTFTKNEYVRSLFDESSKCFAHKPEAENYYNGIWLRHPAQNNLYNLSVSEKIKIIIDFLNKKDIPIEKINNYEDWLRVQYGDYFAENFPMKYTRKYWTVEANELETKWVGNRMHKSSIEEILQGAMQITDSIDYYTKEMRYPEKGGFQSLLKDMVNDLTIKFKKDVKEIDIRNKILYFSDGSIIEYDTIFSSIPLPEIVKKIKNAPDSIKKAADNLLNTSGYMVSIGLKKKQLPCSLWFYIYDEDILASRVYSPSMQSPDNAPDGFSSLQAEIFFSRKKKLDLTEDQILNNTIDGLIKMGIFSHDEIVLTDIRKEEYANIVFTPEIYKSRRIVIDFVKKEKINPIGRFGEWAYLWSDQSLLSGKNAADNFSRKHI